MCMCLIVRLDFGDLNACGCIVVRHHSDAINNHPCVCILGCGQGSNCASQFKVVLGCSVTILTTDVDRSALVGLL